VKTIGDGCIVEFGSVVDAVRCAIAIQRGATMRNVNVIAGRRLEYRIGVNLGDVVAEEDDLGLRPLMGLVRHDEAQRAAIRCENLNQANKLSRTSAA